MKNVVADSTDEREYKEKTSCLSYVSFFVCDHKMTGYVPRVMVDIQPDSLAMFLWDLEMYLSSLSLTFCVYIFHRT